MNPNETEPNPVNHPLEFDLEQWRNDIRTFSSTTHDLLEALLAELSRTCNYPDSPNDRGVSRSVTKSSISGGTHETNHEIPSEKKLARIREQIAKRISANIPE